jgi:hypothetical protein
MEKGLSSGAVEAALAETAETGFSAKAEFWINSAAKKQRALVKARISDFNVRIFGVQERDKEHTLPGDTARRAKVWHPDSVSAAKRFGFMSGFLLAVF